MLRFPLEKVPELIVRMEQAGAGHRVPVLRAAGSGAICYAEASREGRVPARVLKDPRPHLVLLGDDDAFPTGPAGWPQARTLVRWARRVVVHAAGGRAEDYELAAAAAVVTGRVLLVETTMAHLEAWCVLVQGVRPAVPTLVFRTPPGQPLHPRLSAPPGQTVQ